jgi:protein-tyrosine-phosphatase
MGSDLRLVATALKLVTDIERIGDMCSGIAEWTIELAQEPHGEHLPDITAMAHAVRDMVAQAMQAFVTKDTRLAQSVIEADLAVDAYYAQVFRRTLDRMVEDRFTVAWATRVQAVAKNLERIGDHATNLAEMVVFMVQGKDIRHGAARTEREACAVRGILFLCVQNAVRSQMAEAWARSLLPPEVGIWSAGSAPNATVDSRTVQVMTEVGIDISSQKPKRISDIPLGRIDTVITLCVEEICVTLPGIVRRETWGLRDPAAVGSGEATLAAFREVRDELKLRIENLATVIRDS